MKSDLKEYFRKRNNKRRAKRVAWNFAQALGIFVLIVVVLALITITFIIL